MRFLGAGHHVNQIAACVAYGAFEKWFGAPAPGEADPDSLFRKGVTGDWLEFFCDRTGLSDRSVGQLAAQDRLPGLTAFLSAGWQSARAAATGDALMPCKYSFFILTRGARPTEQ